MATEITFFASIIFASIIKDMWVNIYNKKNQYLGMQKI